MCRLIETVCVEDGRIIRAPYHSARMNAARKELWNTTDELNIEHLIDRLPYGRTRCRISYGKSVEGVAYFPYQLRPVHRLRMVDAPADIDYHLKYADRSALDRLFALRGEADDVLIVRNGFLTDTSIGNVAFFDGESWFTPAHPLLKGTHRQYLLDEGLLQERDIVPADLPHYERLRIFNAMIHWGEVELELPRAVIS